MEMSTRSAMNNRTALVRCGAAIVAIIDISLLEIRQHYEVDSSRSEHSGTLAYILRPEHHLECEIQRTINTAAQFTKSEKLAANMAMKSFC